jgi:hypothetical protein
VLHEGWPILLVSHDEDDEGWQFINGEGDTHDVSDLMYVHAKHMVALDPGLVALTDLPLGWQAVRDTRDDTWSREPTPPDEDSE